MPEGDTVKRTATRLHAALAGQPLLVGDLRWPSIALADLRGAATTEVVSRGKHLLHRLDDGRTLHSHLRMEGQWRIDRTATGRTDRLAHSPDTRAILGTREWTAYGLRLGMLDLVRTAQESELVGHLGPDVLGPDWEADRALANLASSEETIGAALLDQRHLAGVGTMWAAESLFLLRVWPWARPLDLPAGTLEELLERIHRIMSAAVGYAVQSSTGVRRRGETTYVHGRSGRPCRRCGATVRVAMVGAPLRERTMFYCPGCQGGLAPTDDGRPVRPLGFAAGAARGRRRDR